MASNSSNTVLNPRRPFVIVSMLFASLLLIGVLGWQSFRLQQSNDVAVESVLREYGTLVADEFGRRLTSALGYRGYYQLISLFDDPQNAAQMDGVLSASEQSAETARLIAGFFVFDGVQLSTANISWESELEILLRSIYTSAATVESPYHSVYSQTDGEQLIYADRIADNGIRKIYGFSVNAAGVSDYMRDAFDSGPLLPTSLAGGRVSNDLLFVEVADPAGNVLLDINRQYDSNLTISKTLGDDYQGILENYILRVSVDPNAASLLVIGGLPKSRLPLLLFIMTMVIALMLAAIWLFRREQSVMALRSDFVSQVSHELRTPLTQIRMFAETLLLDRVRTDDERTRSLEIIDRESRRLSYLVDNLLRFSNISDASLSEQHWQNLAPIIADICDTFRLNGSGPAVQLSADEAVQANIDADALRQIVINLLDNAVKFGPQQQLIKVSLQDESGAARISVADQGPGIPAAEHKRVWESFYRLKREENTAISGTGIGLSIVRELVEAMHGRCWIDDADEGARIIIEFITSDGHD